MPFGSNHHKGSGLYLTKAELKDYGVLKKKKPRKSKKGYYQTDRTPKTSQYGIRSTEQGIRSFSEMPGFGMQINRSNDLANDLARLAIEKAERDKVAERLKLERSGDPTPPALGYDPGFNSELRDLKDHINREGTKLHNRLLHVEGHGQPQIRQNRGSPLGAESGSDRFKSHGSHNFNVNDPATYETIPTPPTIHLPNSDDEDNLKDPSPPATKVDTSDENGGGEPSIADISARLHDLRVINDWSEERYELERKLHEKLKILEHPRKEEIKNDREKPRTSPKFGSRSKTKPMMSRTLRSNPKQTERYGDFEPQKKPKQWYDKEKGSNESTKFVDNTLKNDQWVTKRAKPKPVQDREREEYKEDLKKFQFFVDASLKRDDEFSDLVHHEPLFTEAQGIIGSSEKKAKKPSRQKRFQKFVDDTLTSDELVYDEPLNNYLKSPGFFTL